jgi:hypothetical protein
MLILVTKNRKSKLFFKLILDRDHKRNMWRWTFFKNVFKKGSPPSHSPHSPIPESKNASPSRKYQDDYIAKLKNKPNSQKEKFNNHDAIVSKESHTYEKKDGSFVNFSKTETRSITHAEVTQDGPTLPIGHGSDIKKNIDTRGQKINLTGHVPEKSEIILKTDEEIQRDYDATILKNAISAAHITTRKNNANILEKLKEEKQKEDES